MSQTHQDIKWKRRYFVSDREILGKGEMKKRRKDACHCIWMRDVKIKHRKEERKCVEIGRDKKRGDARIGGGGEGW